MTYRDLPISERLWVTEPQEGSRNAAHDSRPGEKLFSEVVGHRVRHEQTQSPSSVTTNQQIQLRDSVADVQVMVTDLEVQLNHLVTINEALRNDLKASQRSQEALEDEKRRLCFKIEAMERDQQTSAELREEMRHMNDENELLARRLAAAHTEVEALSQESQGADALIDKLRKDSDALAEKVERLEERLVHSGGDVDKLCHRLQELQDAKDAQTHQIGVVEQRLYLKTQERDRLAREVEAASHAVAQVTRSIVEVNVHSRWRLHKP